MAAITPSADQAIVPHTGEDDPESEDKKMTLQEHLEELRTRLMWMCGAVLIGTLIAVPVTDPVFLILRRLLAERFEIISITPTEGFMTWLTIAVFIGLGLAMPMIVYQLAMFVAPALTKQEKRFILMTLPPIFGFFVLGVLFSYFLVIPNALNFLVGFGEEHLGVRPLIHLDEYISFVLMLMFWVGVSFETPVIIVALKKIGILTDARLKTYRKFFIVFAFIAAAFITPTPDPLNQLIVAVPIIVLYEVGVLFAKLV